MCKVPRTCVYRIVTSPFHKFQDVPTLLVLEGNVEAASLVPQQRVQRDGSPRKRTWKLPFQNLTSRVSTCPGSLSRSFGVPSRREGPPNIWDTWYIGKRFCKSRCVIISTLSSRIESLEFIDRGAASFIHSGKG